MIVRITHGGVTVDATSETWQARMDELIAQHGPWDPGSTKVEKIEAAFEPEALAPADPAAAKGFSSWGAGKQIVDADAAARITKMQEALGIREQAEAGQLYQTGTRMAEVGYQTQREREQEHRSMAPARETIRAFIAQVEGEGRRDVEVAAGDLAAGLAMNGRLTFDGMAIREQAVRGLLARLDSPAGRYVFGLKERIKESSGEGRQADKAALLDVLQREARRFPDIKLKLRTRPGSLGDVFTIVSPEYVAADAPTVLPDLVDALPESAKASIAYNPVTTLWEVRAKIWTPTPVQEQAVGEPFEGYASLRSIDTGIGRLIGGGGMNILACLNAMIHAVSLAEASRVHRGRILTDVGALIANAMAGLKILVDAWPIARADVIPAPVVDGTLIPLEEAIPGFFRAMLTQRRGELVGVLPGRTEAHVGKLAATYVTERRNPTDLVRSDLAQAYTRYVRDQPSSVRPAAEQAIGAWLVNREPVRYVAA